MFMFIILPLLITGQAYGTGAVHELRVSTCFVLIPFWCISRQQLSGLRRAAKCAGLVVVAALRGQPLRRRDWGWSSKSPVASKLRNLSSSINPQTVRAGWPRFQPATLGTLAVCLES
ncbi:hypothetical protein FE257_001556 [Aspergillus nanangensis]|uniref:Secreted protein n=1 Tax=Aspergillus nanangensis TaxID=2582783 RepID=A0AAD4CU18_ASPNN|nr:hypothetical protein FE257_001556 [Aspergillus nanangensis]